MPKLAEQAGAGLGSRLLRRLSKRDQEGGTDSKNSSASGIVFLNSIFFSELVCQFQPFPDRRSQPPSNTLWSLCCFPRPLQQVQANRVKRGQRCLHGALHPEHGREQKARQKCELQLNFNNIPSSKLLSRWASRGNFRAEPWNAEIQLKASPPLLRGELSGEHKKTKKQEEGFSHQHCQMSQS